MGGSSFTSRIDLLGMYLSIKVEHDPIFTLPWKNSKNTFDIDSSNRRAARENFLMTGVAVTQQAAYEPALHHTGEEHEEGNLHIVCK